MDRTKAKVLRKLAEDAVRQALKDANLGVSFETGRGTFSASDFTLKVTFAELKDGKATTKMQRDFEAHCKMFGFDPDDLGKRFESRNKFYHIEGLKPSATKFPVLAREQAMRGRLYKFQAHAVLEALGKKVPVWLAD